MVAKAANLYAAVTQTGSVARLGEVTVLRMDGAGAIAAPALTFNTVARWAQGKPATGILQKDRMLFLDRFEIFLARPASMVQTRGSAKPLYDLLQAMERIGLDIHEWSIPHSVEELIKETAGAQEPTKDAKDKDAQDSQPSQEVPKIDPA
ncbi:MAG: hypothetical protein ACRES4_03300 [Nevskiales bacterium]